MRRAVNALSCNRDTRDTSFSGRMVAASRDSVTVEMPLGLASTMQIVIGGDYVVTPLADYREKTAPPSPFFRDARGKVYRVTDERVPACPKCGGEGMGKFPTKDDPLGQNQATCSACNGKGYVESAADDIFRDAVETGGGISKVRGDGSSERVDPVDFYKPAEMTFAEAVQMVRTELARRGRIVHSPIDRKMYPVGNSPEAANEADCYNRLAMLDVD
jgi:hypothetical protein